RVRRTWRTGRRHRDRAVCAHRQGRGDHCGRAVLPIRNRAAWYPEDDCQRGDSGRPRSRAGGGGNPSGLTSTDQRQRAAQGGRPMTSARDAKEWAFEHLKGIGTSPLTVFNPDFTLDDEGLAFNVDYLVTGLDVDTIGYGHGEPWSLSHDERKRSAETFL